MIFQPLGLKMCIRDRYKSTIEDEILNDIEDLGLFDDNNQWNFYITFEELKRLEYGYKVQYLSLIHILVMMKV